MTIFSFILVSVTLTASSISDIWVIVAGQWLRHLGKFECVGQLCDQPDAG
jgi:hypothetical protein